MRQSRRNQLSIYIQEDYTVSCCLYSKLNTYLDYTMKTLKQFIKESLIKEENEEFSIDNLAVRYDCPSSLFIQIPSKYSESDMQIYLDDELLDKLPGSSQLAKKFFGKNSENIIDAYFEYDSISQAMGKEQKADLVWDEKYDNNIKDSSELTIYQISNLKYIIEFEKFSFDNTIDDTNVRETIENLLQTTVSNSINKYPIEISLNNSNITFDDEN